MNEPIYEVKPNYKILCDFCSNNAATVLALLILLMPAIKLGFVQYYVIVLIIYALYIIISNLIRKRNSQLTTYSFYEDRVVITKKKKVTEVFYADLKDIMLYQSAIQKMFNLGQIILKLESRNIFRSDIVLADIEDIMVVAQDINQIVYRSEETNE